MTSKYRIWVYKNLTSKVWSGKLNSNGKVFHLDYQFILYEVSCKVRPGGLKSVRRNKKKTPCAFLLGELYLARRFNTKKLLQINFDPYKDEYFSIVKDDKKILLPNEEIIFPRVYFDYPKLKVYIDDFI